MEGLDLARLQRSIETSSKRKMSRVVKIEYVVEQERERDERDERCLCLTLSILGAMDGQPRTPQG